MDELLSKCLAGEKWAWDAFAQRYAPVILSAVRRVLRGRGVAGEDQSVEDLVQEVFLRLVKNDLHLLRSYNPDAASLVTWLTIIARSTAIDFLRHKRLATVTLDDAPPLPARSEPPDSPQPTAQLLPEGLVSEQQRLVLHLMYDKEMEVEEIARLLGVAEQTVRSAKHKGLLKLREYYRAKESP